MWSALLLPRSLIILAASLQLGGCYSVSQGFEQGKLLYLREPIADAHEDPKLSTSQKKNLEALPMILEFAESQGLRTAGAYSKYVSMDRSAVSYSMAVAKSDKLELVTWWFPIVGDVPYLAFFDQEKRDQAAAEYQAKGFDVSTGSVAAFSSLGWFDDPIYSPMLSRSPLDFAQLIFHELVHRTYWDKENVKFNEILAEYCAIVLTRRYLEKLELSEESSSFEAELRDIRKFRKWLRDAFDRVSKFYQANSEASSDFREKKAQVFAGLRAKEFVPKFEVIDPVSRRSWNNASILSAMVYDDDDSELEAAFACALQPKVGEFLNKISQSRTINKDVSAALRQLCTKS